MRQILNTSVSESNQFERRNQGEATDPAALLQARVKEYAQRVATRLGTAATRSAELDRLFKALIDRRVRMLQDEVLGSVDETGDRLLPTLKASGSSAVSMSSDGSKLSATEFGNVLLWSLDFDSWLETGRTMGGFQKF